MPEARFCESPPGISNGFRVANRIRRKPNRLVHMSAAKDALVGHSSMTNTRTNRVNPREQRGKPSLA